MNIKSYTSIEQSRVLAEILPLESADMYYSHEFVNSAGDYYKLNTASEGYFDDEELLGSDIPCWSLAALLGVLPNGIVMNKDSQNGRYHFSSKYVGTYVTADNPIDACYEMILMLNELNLL